jgi:hypothetical protein
MTLARRIIVPTALLVLAAALAAGAGARRAALPTLYVNYTMNCTFTITDDSGRTVSSILPGTYQVDVHTPVVFADVDLSGISDMTACKSFVQFELNGPGVSLQTTLQDGDEADGVLRATFQPSATYTAQDDNQASVTRTTFTTQATGTAGAATSSSGSSSSGGAKGSTQQSLVGSDANPFRGSLDAIVSAAGKLSLTRNGRPVTSLRSGRWTFSVDDESKKAGFGLQILRGRLQSITTAAFVGSHDVTVELKPGRWTYFSAGGKKTTFFVIS